MRKATMLMVSVLALTAAGAAGQALSQEKAKKGGSITVLATLPVDGQRVIKLVEYIPGVTGVVESVPVHGARVLTPELKKLSMADLYRHFAGKQATVPDAVAAADARAAALAKAGSQQRESSAAPSAPPWKKRTPRPIPEMDTEDEIWNWFYPIYCEQYGATDCQLNYDFATSESAYAVGFSEACLFDGSEGAPAEAAGWYWDWNASLWIRLYAEWIQPGWAQCYAITGNGNSFYMAWDMWGAGWDATVGLAHYY